MATVQSVDARADQKDPAEIDRTEGILEADRKWFRRAAEAESQLRARMLADQKFSANLSGHDQWQDRAVVERTRDGRPFLSVDRLSHPIYSLVNQARESGDAIRVSPVDNGADPETAEVIQGLTRNIETQSRAKLAYTWGIEGAIRMGRGFVRIVPEYVVHPSRHQFENRQTQPLDPRLFEQDLRIKRVLNPFTVYCDPACEEPDYSDGRKTIIHQDLALDDYLAQYGHDSIVTGFDTFSSIGDDKPYWLPNNGIRIAEVYEIESTFEEIVLVRDAQGTPLVLLKRELADVRKQLGATRNFIQGDAELTRKLEIRQLHWRKINGVEILQEQELPGKWIPVIPIIGEELFVDGERDYRGIVRGAKDAAVVYNYSVTGLVEAVGLTPKAPYIIAAGQLKGFEKFWDDANVKLYPYLPYNQTDVGGRLVPPPQRNTASPPIGALVAQIVQADNDVKAATRYSDASLGKEGPEQSGKAILARQRQGDTGTSHYLANFRDISLTHIGRILVDLIPSYYDTARIARIIGTDERPKTVMLNQPFEDEQGIARVFQMDVGTYDVAVMAGPGYATKQEETKQLLMQIVDAVPGAFPHMADRIFESLGAYDLAKRFEKLLPPELREPKPGEPPPIPPEVKQQMDALMQQHELLTAELNQKNELLAQETAKTAAQVQMKQAELASKERIAADDDKLEALKLEIQRGIAELEARTELAKIDAQNQAKQAQIVLEAGLEKMHTLLEARLRVGQERETRGVDEQHRREDQSREDRQRQEDQIPAARQPEQGGP